MPDALEDIPGEAVVVEPDSVEPEIDPAIDPDLLPFSAGIPPAAIGKVLNLDQDFLDTTKMRSKFRRLRSLPGQNVLFEFACSDDSILGQVCESVGVQCIRLSESTLDLCDPAQLSQAIGQVESLPGSDAWVSVVCTHHSPWQHLNKSIHGEAYKEKLRKKQKVSLKFLRNAEKCLCILF